MAAHVVSTSFVWLLNSLYMLLNMSSEEMLRRMVTVVMLVKSFSVGFAKLSAPKKGEVVLLKIQPPCVL